MKTRKILVMIIAFLMILSASVFAYDGEGWSIDLSEDDYDVLKQDTITLFQKSSGDNIVVQKIEQKVFGGKLTQYQLSAITKEITDQYKKTYDATVEELGRDEYKLNNYDVTRMKFKTDIEGYTILQEMNIIISGDNVYDIIFTSFTENGFSDQDKTTILKSFKITDETSANNTEETNTNTDENTNTINNNEITPDNSGETKATEEFPWKEVGILGVLVVAIVIIVVSGIAKNKNKKEKTDDTNNQ